MKVRALPLPLLILLILVGCGASAVQIAQQHMREGNLDTAYAVLDSTVAIQPENGEALMLLAVVEMRQERFEEAHQHLEQAKKVSPLLTSQIENRIEPALAELESIVWVEFYVEPSVLARRVARFPGPMDVHLIEERQGPWTRACVRRWLPNDEIIQQYRHGPLINVLFEMPEMAYVEFRAWTGSDLVHQRAIAPTEQGVALKVDELNWVAGEKEKTALVFGMVTNYGTITARDPLIRLEIIQLDYHVDNMGFSFAAGDPMGPPTPAALEYLMRQSLDLGYANVPLRPEILRPGESGIIVMTMELLSADVLLSVSGTLYHAEDPPPGPGTGDRPEGTSR